MLEMSYSETRVNVNLILVFLLGLPHGLVGKVCGIIVHKLPQQKHC